MTNISEIEIRYADRGRYFWNNGFRRRWLALGARNAAEIEHAIGKTVPAYRIVRDGRNWMVFIPEQEVSRRTGRKLKRVDWMPMFGHGHIDPVKCRAMLAA